MSDYPVAGRRHDLDWLRVGAFGFLIFYHIGMFYVTWDWHVKSPYAGPGLEPAMGLVNPWRLALLFFMDHLMQKNGRRTIHDLSCQFGARG